MNRSAAEIASVIGRELALRLIGKAPRWPRKDRTGRRVGGEWVVLYVPTPASLTPDHWLVQAIGWPAAEKLADAFGGEILQPGTCGAIYSQFRNRSIQRLHAQGLPVKLLAEWFGVSERHVRNLTREIPRVAEPDHANDNPRARTASEVAA